MPEDRLDRSRRTLPQGYQFGDAAEAYPGQALFGRYLDENIKNPERFIDRENPSQTIANCVDDAAMRAVYGQPWRAPHENAAERLYRTHVKPAGDAMQRDFEIATMKALLGWNVIEGEQFDTDRDPGDEA